MQKILRLAALTLFTTLAACSGKEGATGPTGPQGPQGPQGPLGPAGPGTNRAVFTAPATYDAGTGVYAAVVQLPAAVGNDPTRPPSLDCYQTNNPAGGTWLSVAGTATAGATYCAVVFTSGAWRAVMSQMSSGWTAAFVVTY